MPDLEVFAMAEEYYLERRNETRRVIKASRVKSNGNYAKDSQGRSRTSGTKMWKTTCLECNILWFYRAKKTETVLEIDVFTRDMILAGTAHPEYRLSFWKKTSTTTYDNLV